MEPTVLPTLPAGTIASRSQGRRAVPLASACSFALLAGALLAAPAIADDGQNGDAADTAGPSVARVSLVQGGVSIKRGDSSDDVEASTNAPLLAADYLSTGTDGRAEVQYDGVSLLRLDADTQVRFANLDQGKREAQLAEGTVEIRELQGDDGQPQLDTPSISLRPLGTGSYRVTVTPDGTTIVTVRDGRLAVVTPTGTTEVDAGQSIVAQGSADNPNVQSRDVVPSDDFDTFNGSRDRLELRALGQTGFNAQVDGDELDSYGNWENVPSYGRVWHPNEAANWAPYHDGRWVWEDAYGWTWVSAEPWGWAPYHYGRWFYNAGYGGWLWTPPVYGPAYAPAYAYAPEPQLVFWRPALVSFFGFGFGGGSGISLDVGFGNVGWVALAPNEIYHPWYGAGNGWNGRGGYGREHDGPTYNTTNITNVTNVTNVTNINYGNITRNYANAGAPGAIATVDTRRFLQGNYRPTTVNVTSLRTANVGEFRGPLPLAPTRQNLTFTNHPAPVTNFRPARTQVTFAGNAPATNRYRFNDQRTEITNNLQSHNLPVRPEAFTQASVIPSTRSTGARLPSTVSPRYPTGGGRLGTGTTTGTTGERLPTTGGTGTYRVPVTGNVPPRTTAPSGTGDSPWSRFPGRLTPGGSTTSGTTGTARYPTTANGGNRSTTGGTTGGYRVPTTGTTGPNTTTGGGYRAPMSSPSGGDRAPATGSTGGYRPPATGSTGGYRAPTTGSTTNYPSTTTGGGYRPPTVGGYRSPATGSTGGYRAPATGSTGGYRAPTSSAPVVRTPNRPATTPEKSVPPTTPSAPTRPI